MAYNNTPTQILKTRGIDLLPTVNHKASEGSAGINNSGRFTPTFEERAFFVEISDDGTSTYLSVPFKGTTATTNISTLNSTDASIGIIVKGTIMTRTEANAGFNLAQQAISFRHYGVRQLLGGGDNHDFTVINEITTPFPPNTNTSFPIILSDLSSASHPIEASNGKFNCKLSIANLIGTVLVKGTYLLV